MASRMTPWLELGIRAYQCPENQRSRNPKSPPCLNLEVLDARVGFSTSFCTAHIPCSFQPRCRSMFEGFSDLNVFWPRVGRLGS